MVKNKKMLMAISFCIGAVMLATTAFADVTTKTGYDQLKDVAKFTAESMTKKLQSYTFESTMILKDNDKLLTSQSTISKADNVGKMTQDSSTTEDFKGVKHSSYSYRDSKSNIFYNNENDTYYVTEYDGNNEFTTRQNPFASNSAKDIEKIADALVGNLKDYVVVDEKSDGSKELSGSLSEAQIPSLINAVSSFAFKQRFAPQINPYRSETMAFPEITEDIFIKNVEGKVTMNKDGLMESFLATGILSGKDTAGNAHDLTVEVLVRLTDINATTVTKPDLNGKKVEKNISRAVQQEIVPEKFIGKYKNDIIIDKDDKFIKIGERFVEISSIDDKHVVGKYYEQYKDEYIKEYKNDKNDFAFDANFNMEKFGAFVGEFQCSNSAVTNQKGNINFDMNQGKIYFYIANEGAIFDRNFSRVFDE